MYALQITGLTGNYISGYFALGGVLLGAILTFLQQLYSRYKDKKNSQERDIMNERKTFYLQLVNFLIQINDCLQINILDHSDLLNFNWDFLINPGMDFITTKKSYLYVYATEDVRDSACEYFSIFSNLYKKYTNNEYKDIKEVYEEVKKLLQLNGKIISLIREELGILR